MSPTSLSYVSENTNDEETSLLSGRSGSVSSRPRRRNRQSRSGNVSGSFDNYSANNSNNNSGSNNAESTVIRQMHMGLLWNRFLSVLLLGVFVGVAVYFQRYLAALKDTLANEQQEYDKLHEQLLVHQQVIDRFNASVTNNDVLEQLSVLKNDLYITKHSLQTQLENTQTDIAKQLNTTLSELSETVVHAEKEISDEVEKVKRDVEHYVVTTQDQFSMENSFMVYQLAGTFTLLSCLISMWHMTAHLRKMNQPDVQRKILAILWMSPIYAITSWFSLVFHSAEGYLAIIKDGYEAYIIYQFLSFCIAVLGKGDRHAVVELLARHASHLTPPFRICGICETCCCRSAAPLYESDRALADAILLQCQLFAMQFVFFRPLTTTAMVILEQTEYYGAGTGPTDYRSPQFYITILQNLSIFCAFTGLLKFYHAVDKELQWCRPFAKFLCIKGVVFMTFWQGLALSVLAQTTDVGGTDAEEWAKSAQNFLICLEMLLFSIAHFYCFPTDEWEDGYRDKATKAGKFGDSLALGDFLQDLKLIVRSNAPRKRRASKKNSTLPEVEEEDEQYEEQESGSSAEFESEGSETQALTIDTGMSDEERINYMLEKHLGAVGKDEDIMLAKQRLLESGILSPDFFDEIHSDDENLDHERPWSDDGNDESSYSEEEEDLPIVQDDHGKTRLDDDEENVLHKDSNIQSTHEAELQSPAKDITHQESIPVLSQPDLNSTVDATSGDSNADKAESSHSTHEAQVKSPAEPGEDDDDDMELELPMGTNALPQHGYDQSDKNLTDGTLNANDESNGDTHNSDYGPKSAASSPSRPGGRAFTFNDKPHHAFESQPTGALTSEIVTSHNMSTPVPAQHNEHKDSSTGSQDMLKPSIFTAVASIAETERQSVSSICSSERSVGKNSH